MIAPTLGALFGAAFGSFLNVVIYRLPRGESLVFPASHCPSCGHTLGPLDNVPLVSWVMLRGRCRYCGAAIAARYPLVETLTACLFALSFLEFGPTLTAFGACALGALLIVIAFIDLDHLLVLDGTTISGALIGLALAIATHRLVPALEGALAGAVIFGAIYLLTRGAGMGLGDVKLAAMLGLFLGFPLMLWTAAAAFIIGALLAIPVLVARRRGRRDALPFGPFLVIAAILATFVPALFAGPYDAYHALFGN
ncbi:MAG TPA: prepilin peptidase [Candidatus Eremiobacteraceae bacterium]|nr:prepilin peptidase [Candidatus Eremiobacteraceae bacterium]